MNISKASWKQYTDKQAAIRLKAAELMKAWIAKNGTDDRDAMVRFASSLVNKYGEAAAAYACQMYDRIAEADRADIEAANPAEIPTYQDIAKVVNGALLGSIAGLQVIRAVERLVKQTAADTMLQNAIRDGAEFAWIPDGGACPFCLGIGAEGWKTASAKITNGGHAEHIHASCSCEFAIRFDEDSNVDGYDPEALTEEVESASEKELREEYNEENRDKINEQRREARMFNTEVLENESE